MHIVITQYRGDYSTANKENAIVEKSESLERGIVIDGNAYDLAELETAIGAIKNLFG